MVVLAMLVMVVDRYSMCVYGVWDDGGCGSSGGCSSGDSGGCGVSGGVCSGGDGFCSGSSGGRGYCGSGWCCYSIGGGNGSWESAYVCVSKNVGLC